MGIDPSIKSKVTPFVVKLEFAHWSQNIATFVTLACTEGIGLPPQFALFSV